MHKEIEEIEINIIEKKKEELRELEQARFDRLVEIKAQELPEGTDHIDIVAEVVQDEIIRQEEGLIQWKKMDLKKHDPIILSMILNCSYNLIKNKRSK